MKVPTVKVQSKDAPGGFVVINEKDFDASAHKLFDEAAEPESKPKTRSKSSK